MNIQIDKLKGPLMHEHKSATKGPILDYGLGALYNWFVASDIRNIAASGWKVANGMNFTNLMLFIDPTAVSNNVNNAGNAAKSTGTNFWTSGDGLNQYGFNARGAGRRAEIGFFSQLKEAVYFWSTSYFDHDDFKSVSCLLGSDNTFYVSWESMGGEQYKQNSGHCIALVKESTILLHGQTGTYTGNDGKIYPTICINGTEWVSMPLCETKFRNGDLIPIVTDNATWGALVSAGMCYYNNDHGNGYQSGLSTDNAIARWDGTDGKTIQNSKVTISDDGEVYIEVGANKEGLHSKSGYLAIEGEGVGPTSYGISGKSDNVPAQFANMLKTVTGIRQALVLRGDSANLVGPVEIGYALRQLIRLPVNDFVDPAESEVNAGAIDCIWSDITTTLEACDFIFSLQHNGVLKPSMKLSGHGELFLRDANNTKWNQVPPPDEIKIDIDFLDLTPFVYNVPENMKLFQHQYEISAAILSEPLNTNMNKYTRLTITPTAIGLVSLKGILL